MNEMAKPSVWSIEQAASAAARVRERLAELDPSLLDDDTTLADMLDGETDALDIARRLVRYSLEQQSLAYAAEARARDLKARQARFEARVEAARDTVRDLLDTIGVHRIQDPEFTVSLRMGKPRLMTTGEPPDGYARLKREWDRDAARAALERGEPVEHAMLSNAMPTLTVRTK